MKRNFIMFFVICLLAAASFVITKAQSSKTKESSEEKQLSSKEIQAIEKFADYFSQSLQNTKDINKVPRRFFAADFKERFSQSNIWFEQDSKMIAQMSSEEHYQNTALMFNFIYLSLLFSIGSSVGSERLESKDMFPLAITNLVKSNPALSSLLDKDNDGDVANIQQLRSRMTAMGGLVDAFRKYLVEHPKEWKTQFDKEITSSKDKLNDAPSVTKCVGKECRGLSSNTALIYANAFPLVLTIVKNHNNFEIIEIEPVSQ